VADNVEHLQKGIVTKKPLKPSGKPLPTTHKPHPSTKKHGVRGLGELEEEVRRVLCSMAFQ
jgi:hypothetical protein